MKPINLFEYQNKENSEVINLDELDTFLDEIWARRDVNSFYSEEKEDDKTEKQQFLQIFKGTKQLKSNKYVGVIHFQKHKINLLPKIFYSPTENYDDRNKVGQIRNHILWWLSYCRKIRFPNYQTSLSSKSEDFFEILIYLFSKYTRELLSSSIYQNYEEQSGELINIRGRLNVNAYINENLSKGNWQKVNCDYDAFVIDNKFNRIIKYVTQLLFTISEDLENKRYLREILFILDEVSDVPATASDCASISFNPVFDNFKIVRDYCLLFLNNSISFSHKSELELFAFLLPMEYVFEDFIYGFINKELPHITTYSQRKDTYLVENNKYQLKPDLVLEFENDKKIIADTKYKIIYNDDPKKKISQSDLYQMLAYAVRFSIDELILFYPNFINTKEKKIDTLMIVDKFADKTITIKAFQLPIICEDIYNRSLNRNETLEETFFNLKKQLKDKLEEIFKEEEKE